MKAIKYAHSLMPHHFIKECAFFIFDSGQGSDYNRAPYPRKSAISYFKVIQ
jgi:hypothetical protein